MQHQRVDSPYVNQLPPTELLLYRPVRGGLPDVRSGVRLGPAELYTRNRYIAQGDWDGDQRTDLLLSQTLWNDTTQGLNKSNLVRVVVYWQQEDGSFSRWDTTHLESLTDVWGGISDAHTGRFGQDGVDDLAVWGGASWVDGRRVETPEIVVYQGHTGRRWGRDGVGRRWSWGLWRTARNPGFVTQFNRMAVMDTDGDRADDIVFYTENVPGTGIEVLYGRSGQLPDTNEREWLDLDSIGAHYIQLQDLTGDGVPELTYTTGSNHVVRVYMGTRGQRLKEMFGSGLDPAEPGRPRGWARPWTEVWMPQKFGYWGWYDTEWFPAFGDGNMDGVPDLWAWAPPYLVRYDGGRYLDSYVDGIAYSGSNTVMIASLGDIDSSGVASIAVMLSTRTPLYDRDPGTVRYYKLPPCRSSVVPVRELPPGTDTPAGAPIANSERARPSVMISPNPASLTATISWNHLDGASAVELCDLLGTVLQRHAVHPHTSALSISVAGLARGIYFVRLRGTEASRTVVLRVR